MNEEREIADDIDPMYDTGRAARAAYDMSKRTYQKMVEFCDKWDREHAEEQKQQQAQHEAIKRGVMQILKGIGWIK